MATNVDDADHNDSGSGSDSDSVDTIDFDNLDLDRFEDEDDEAAARLPPILLRRPLAWGAETNRKFVAILSLYMTVTLTDGSASKFPTPSLTRKTRVGQSVLRPYRKFFGILC